MKFIEQQLLSALSATPLETDCSISAAVLKGIGLGDREAQSRWLENHRAARAGKFWSLLGERWEYTAAPTTPLPMEAPSPLNWRTASALADSKVRPIVVKPLAPLPGARERSSGNQRTITASNPP